MNSVPISLLTPPSSIVCNLSREGTQGSHFVVIVIEKGNVTLYDSYGKLGWIITEDLKRLIKRIRDHFHVKLRIATPRAIQDEQSQFCGFFSIYFILKNEVKYVRNLIPWDEKRMKLNDSHCIENIIRIIKHMKHYLFHLSIFFLFHRSFTIPKLNTFNYYYYLFF